MNKFDEAKKDFKEKMKGKMESISADDAVKKIAKDFHKNMQELADKDGCTVSTMSVNGGKEVVIAEPSKKEEPLPYNVNGDNKFNFTSPLHLACAKDNLRPAMECVHFKNGYAYSSNGHLLAKQSLLLHTILHPEKLEGKAIHKKSYEQILTFDIVEASDKNIICKRNGGEAEFMYAENLGKIPDWDSVIPKDKPIKGIEYLGINTKFITIAGKILHGSDMGVRMTFRGGGVGVILTTEEYEDQLVMVMPLNLEPTLGL